VAEYFSTI
jgi:ATP-dependent RNA helicase DDX18/HAS1